MATKHAYPCRGCHLAKQFDTPTDTLFPNGRRRYARIWLCSRNGQSFPEIDQTTSCADNPKHIQE